MVSTNDIRPGQSIIVDDVIYQIMEYAHVKPGKGKAFVKTKLKNMKDGGIIEKTFRADENVEQAFIDKKQFQYLYSEGEAFIFMNNETYEQISLDQDKLKEIEFILVPNNDYTIQMYETRPIDVVTPPSVAEEFNSLLPNSELSWIDKCGHAPMMEHPKDFNIIMENWLSKNNL